MHVVEQCVSGADYVQASQWKTRGKEMLGRVFEQVDLIVTPTCANLAPLINAGQSETFGSSDLTNSSASMRFIFLANLLGNPAVTFPVAYARGSGLPIGVQFMADMYAFIIFHWV